MAKIPEEMWDETDEGHRIEDDGQTAIGDTPPPVPVLNVSVGTTTVNVTDPLRILTTQTAAEEGQEITITIRGKVMQSGGVKKLQTKGLVYGLSVSPDSAQIRLR